MEVRDWLTVLGLLFSALVVPLSIAGFKMWRRMAVHEQQIENLVKAAEEDRKAAEEDRKSAAELLRVATKNTGSIAALGDTCARFQKNHEEQFSSIGKLQVDQGRNDEKTQGLAERVTNLEKKASKSS